MGNQTHVFSNDSQFMKDFNAVRGYGPKFVGYAVDLHAPRLLSIQPGAPQREGIVHELMTSQPFFNYGTSTGRMCSPQISLQSLKKASDMLDRSLEVIHHDDQRDAMFHPFIARNSIFFPPKAITPVSSKDDIMFLTTKTFVDGLDIDNLSDDQVYSIIGKREAQIKTLSGIENKPASLQKKIDDLNADIKAIIAFVDAKGAKKAAVKPA